MDAHMDISKSQPPPPDHPPPVSPPPDAPPPYRSNHTTDIDIIVELKAQNARLEEQNTMLVAILDNMTITGAASEGAANTTASDGMHLTRANKSPTATRFGRESLAHVTPERINAIIANCGRTSQAATVAAVVVGMVKLIYSVPENQPWYTLDDGVLLTLEERGWTMKTSRGEVIQIGLLINQLVGTRTMCGRSGGVNNGPPWDSHQSAILVYVEDGFDAFARDV